MSNKISKERKIVYHMGQGLLALGGILFISSFFLTSQDVGFSMEMPLFFKTALIGMICIIVGGILMGIGAGGAAGSGLILDPEKAREDLKPYNKATGEMINDVIENIDLISNKKQELENNNVACIIKVRCPKCSGLNDEDAKFCKNCGEKI